MSDRLRSASAEIVQFPAPVGVLAARIKNAALFTTLTDLELIANHLRDQEGVLLQLDELDQRKQPYPPHLLDLLRYSAQCVVRITTSMLARGMSVARHERSAGVSPPPHPSLPGADDLVSFTSAPALSVPCANDPTSRHAAGASVPTRADPARISETPTADAPNSLTGEA